MVWFRTRIIRGSNLARLLSPPLPYPTDIRVTRQPPCILLVRIVRPFRLGYRFDVIVVKIKKIVEFFQLKNRLLRLGIGQSYRAISVIVRFAKWSFCTEQMLFYFISFSSDAMFHNVFYEKAKPESLDPYKQLVVNSFFLPLRRSLITL